MLATITNLLMTVPVIHPPPLTEPSFEVGAVSTDRSSDASFVTAYGPDGQVVAEVTVWQAHGEPRIDAIFDDGSYLSVALVDDQLSVDSNDPEVAAERLQLVLDVLETEHALASEAGCYMGAIGAAGGILTGNPVLTMTASFLVACHCLPLIDPDIDSVPGCD